MKKFIVGKKYFIGLILLMATIVLILFVSCSQKGNENKEKTAVPESEKIFLITDDTPNCSMIISNEIFKYINEKDDYSYILDLMNDYFNVVINDEIEPNVVYIKAVSEKIDAEVRLAQVYEPSNKATLLIQIAEAGKSAFNEQNFDNTDDKNNASTIQEDSGNQLINDVTSSLKKIADKGSVHSV